MSAITITQAQDKGLRHHFASLNRFAAGLFAAAGGWPTHPSASLADLIAARYQQHRQRKVMDLATHVETYSPGLAAELRTIAKRG